MLMINNMEEKMINNMEEKKFQLDFICVGPQRTATSWLDKSMRSHPSIALPSKVKETYFLNNKNKKDWLAYEREYFTPRSASSVCGEVAPSCFSNMEAIRKISENGKNVKIIICLRDPVERSLSLHMHYVSISKVSKDLSKAIHEEPSIIQGSKYLHFIKQWEKEFGSDNIFLLPNKWIAEKPKHTLKHLYAFLEIESDINLPDTLSDPYGEKAAPKNLIAVWAANRSAKLLRKLGLHFIANWGRDIGIKRKLIYGGKPLQVVVTDEQKSILRNELHSDSMFVTQLDNLGPVKLSQLNSLSV